MRVELKKIWSINLILEDYSPIDNNFSIWGELSIGLEKSNSGDDFRVFICTPEWLSKNIWEPKLIRHMLIVRKYDLDEITNAINECIEKCNCDTREETAQKLSRYFAWEFEDYSD